jgi:membrane-bound lytic murein transglycosylase MltF
VTPEREQQVAFSAPIQTDVKQIVVTRKDFGPLSSFDQLSGKKVFVNLLTTYYENLQKVNQSLRKQGRPEILIGKADKSLMDEDLLEMVNAGILPATVTLTERPISGRAFSPKLLRSPSSWLPPKATWHSRCGRAIRSSSNWWTSSSRPTP